MGKPKWASLAEMGELIFFTSVHKLLGGEVEFYFLNFFCCRAPSFRRNLM